MVRADKRMEKLREAVRHVCISSSMVGNNGMGFNENSGASGGAKQKLEELVVDVMEKEALPQQDDEEDADGGRLDSEDGEKDVLFMPEETGGRVKPSKVGSEGRKRLQKGTGLGGVTKSEGEQEMAIPEMAALHGINDGANPVSVAEEPHVNEEVEDSTQSSTEAEDETISKVDVSALNVVKPVPREIYGPRSVELGIVQAEQTTAGVEGKTIQPSDVRLSNSSEVIMIPQVPARDNSCARALHRVDKPSTCISPRRPIGRPFPGESSHELCLRDFVNLQSQNAALRAKLARLSRQMARPVARPHRKHVQTPAHKRRCKQLTTPQAFRVDRQAVAKYVKKKLRADEKYLWHLKDSSMGRGKCRSRLKHKPHTPRSSVQRKSLRLIYCNASHLRVPADEKTNKTKLRKRQVRKEEAKHDPHSDPRHELHEAHRSEGGTSDPQSDLVTWTVNDSYDWADSELYQDCHRRLSEAFPDLDACLGIVSHHPSKLPKAFAEASVRLRALWKELRVPHDLQLHQQVLFMDKPNLNNFVRVLNYTARYLTLRTKLLLVFARIKEGREFHDLLRDVLGPSCKRFIVNGLDRRELAVKRD